MHVRIGGGLGRVTSLVYPIDQGLFALAASELGTAYHSTWLPLTPTAEEVGEVVPRRSFRNNRKPPFIVPDPAARYRPAKAHDKPQFPFRWMQDTVAVASLGVVLAVLEQLLNMPRVVLNYSVFDRGAFITPKRAVLNRVAGVEWLVSFAANHLPTISPDSTPRNSWSNEKGDFYPCNTNTTVEVAKRISNVTQV